MTRRVGAIAACLALSLYDISITAIGILDTQLPGGQSGYSFLIILTATFSPGFQLGFGFTLTGVGGLCGINRAMLTDAIQAGLKAHALDAILFPPNPIAERAADHQHPFDDLSTGDRALRVRPHAAARLGHTDADRRRDRVPDRGTVADRDRHSRAAVGDAARSRPRRSSRCTSMCSGSSTSDRRLFSIDATLHDSRIALFTVSGDMAFRLTWGDDPSFLFSVGGFNPHYQPPPSFPTLQRLTVALSADVVKLTLQSYLAVSSNTFQIGAHIEALLNAGSFNVYGWLGFDALIIFSPFSFIVDFTAGLALRSGTSTIMGITVDGTLSGPTPWHVEGDAHVSLLFFDVSVHVSVTIGNAQSNPLPLANAWTPLAAAIATAANWTGAVPPGAPQVVSLAPPSDAAASGRAHRSRGCAHVPTEGRSAQSAHHVVW